VSSIQEKSETMSEHLSDVTRIEIGGKEILLVGTAHISRESVDLVQEIVEEERPDAVCVELDENRVASLRNPDNWEQLDLREVIREGQVLFLVSRLALAAFQKRMGAYTGVKPGAEMLAAIEGAEEIGARVVLCDRDVKITLLRAWRTTPWWKKAFLATTMFAGLFERSEVSEEELKDLREAHNIGAVLEELGDAMPEVKRVVVDERDIFMAREIRESPGAHIVAVVGAAHKPGIERWIHEEIDDELIEEITHVPPKSWLSRLLPMLLPLIVIGLFVWGFVAGNYEQVKTAAIAWVLANGVLSALGTIVARGHPLAVATAFLAAPLTSLNPTIGAGVPTALAQVYFASPKVGDIQRVGDDIIETGGWWSNRLTRVLLVFLFSSLGSAIGTFVAFGWLKNML
jgi:pheromone shutdown-related protein TraB